MPAQGTSALSRLVTVFMIEPVEPLDSIEHDAKNVLTSEQRYCFIDSVCGGTPRPDDHEAGVRVLLERQCVGEGENWWGVDENPIEVSRKPLHDAGQRLRLQQFRRVGAWFSGG